MKDRINTMLSVSLMICLTMSGCVGVGSSRTESWGSGQTSQAASTEKIQIKIGLWDTPTAEYWNHRIEHEFTKMYPHIEVRFESYKNNDDYLQAMRIRMAADELPDIMMMKPNHLREFRLRALPLDEMAYSKKNLYADNYKIDGQIIAAPYISFVELVYYRPSIFRELGLQVPTTWQQFMDVLNKVKSSNQYIPLALGAREAWTTYPFNEFMHHIESGDEYYLTTIAGQDQPFAEGTPFYNSYRKVEDLYRANVMGPDPLGTSFDQATSLFESKRASMIVLGLWYASSYVTKVGSMDDLAVFPLPYRNSEQEPLRVMTFTDNFYMINKHSKQVAAAKKVMEWLFDDKVYHKYMKEYQKGLIGSTMEGFNEYSPFLQSIYDNNIAEPFIYRPGSESYSILANATNLDWKQLGQHMVEGRSLSELSMEWNEKWSKAREGIHKQ
jgi:raffinose/stachyose/melibiose transport system substrate-binding protein